MHDWLLTERIIFCPPKNRKDTCIHTSSHFSLNKTFEARKHNCGSTLLCLRARFENASHSDKIKTKCPLHSIVCYDVLCIFCVKIGGNLDVGVREFFII